MIRDEQGHIKITWLPNGKPSIITDTVRNTFLKFTYDGLGNRIFKDYVKKIDAQHEDHKGEYYVRDASGNILAVYNTHSDYSPLAIIKQANTSVKGLSDFTPFVKAEIAPFPSFKTVLIDTSIRSLPTWVQNETNKTVSFYLNSDDELYNRMLFSNDAYFNDLRSYDNEDERGIYVNALSKLDEGETNLFNEVLAAEGEGAEPIALFRHLDTEIPEDFTHSLWESFGVPHEPEAPDLNAQQLYDYMASSNAYATVAKYMADMLRESNEQAPEQTAAFLTDMINDDVIFKSEALRSEGSKFEYELSGVLYRSGDRNALSGFFDQWEPAKDWLYDNTSLDQRMDIVYTSNPNAEIGSFITATMSNDVLERVIGGLPEMTALDYVEKLVLSFPTQAQSITSLLGAATDTMTLAEHHIYGSGRLGIQTYDTTYRNTYNVDPNVTPLARLSANRTWYSGTSGDFVSYTSKTPWAAIDNSAFRESRTVGKRYYEMTDHLGNVLATVMDRKTGHLPNGGGIGSLYDYWQADLASVQDYYPGGMMMPGRYKSMNGDTTVYRFSYNGKQKDDEVYGFGNFQDYGFRMYNSRIIRFISEDPLTKKYPMLTPYQFASNTPIQAIDVDGLEALFVHGTFSDPSTWDKGFVKNMLKATKWDKVKNSVFFPQWSGANSTSARIKASAQISNWLISDNNPLRDLKHVTLIGHSHGGNVNKLVKNNMEKLGWRVDVINIETPQRNDFQSNNSGIGIYINFYNRADAVQWFGAFGQITDEGSRIDSKAYLNIRLDEGKPFSLTENLKTWTKDAAGHSLHNNSYTQQQIVDETKAAFDRKETVDEK